MTDTSIDVLRQKCHGVLGEYGKFVFGYEDIGSKLLIASIAGRVCHVLAEGVPGLAKTHSMKVMSRLVTGTTFTRVQFTPDMQPKEISGAKVLDLETRKSQIEWGPVLGANWFLADEINRAKTNTQSALLEPMAEGQVTVGGIKRPVEELFIAMATQNPIEQEGTNPLPEAQHDRFLFKLIYDYAELDDELMLLEHPEIGDSSIYEKIVGQISREELLFVRKWVNDNIYVSRIFNEYLAKVCRSTRPGKPEFIELCQKNKDAAEIMKMVKVGVSPRALQGLQRASKVQAFLFGKDPEDESKSRDYVRPADLKALAHAVLRHRIIMKEEASYRKGGAITSEQVVDTILANVIPNDDAKAYNRVS